MKNFNSFNQVLHELNEKKIVTSKITEKIVKIFSMERFLTAMEIITLEEIRKYIFKPSNRVIWVINGRNLDYLVYPKNYCSCMDFYLQGIVKNTKYLCKHLIAQAIFENLGSLKLEKAIISIEDKEFNDFIKELLKI